MSNFLSATLMNINSVWHPCISYGAYRDWDFKTGYPNLLKFYEDVDDFTADLLTNVSNEVLKIKNAFNEVYPEVDLSQVTHVKDWILRSYGDEILDKTNLRTAINTNKGYQGLTHAMVKDVKRGEGYFPNINNRYFQEDIPYGLMVSRGIGEILGVKTPYMDEVISWGQKMMGREYLVDGKL